MKTISKLLLILLVFTAACEDSFLETSPTNQVSPAAALSSPENMMVALNGVHRQMYGQSGLEIGGSSYSYAGEGYIIPWLEFPASDALHSTSGNGWFRAHLQWIVHTNTTSSNLQWIWYHYYHIIGNVNNIINAAEGMTEDATLSNVLGQAKAYRAWAHFRLVRLFAMNYNLGNPDTELGIPLMLATKPPYEGQERATVKAVYEQIVKDIEESIVHFNTASKRADKSHINSNVAKGIAARVYLTMGDWTNAAKYAKEARDGYSPMSETQYKSGFNSVDNPEWMWAGDIVPDQTTYYRAWFYYIGTNFNGSQNRGNPKFINHKLYHMISDTDYRKDMWLEKAPNSVVGWANDPNYETSTAFNAARSEIIDNHGITSRFKTYPYMSVKFKNANAATIDPDDVLYMRASEMYLIEAEALARDNKPSDAAQALYDLVSKRDNAYVKSLKTGDALIEEIKLHKRIELWGEGHRWFDMVRYDEALDRTGTGASSSLYLKGFKQDKPSVNVNWIFRIPQKEIDANGKMKQNPTKEL